MHPVSLPIQVYRGALFAPRRSDTRVLRRRAAHIVPPLILYTLITIVDM